jgi:hypothetical protein
VQAGAPSWTRTVGGAGTTAVETSALVETFDARAERFGEVTAVLNAERNGARILTLDRRQFDVVGRELGLEVLP